MTYEILGEALPVVVVSLDSGESMINQSGKMCWMSPNMKMETFAGKSKRMVGRVLTGESLFLNRYTAEEHEGSIAFSSAFPGKIIAVKVTPNRPVILQKSSFLASTSGVDLSIFFQKRLSSGLFGGEGFVMQKVSGDGIVFAEIDGHAVSYTLDQDQSIVVSTGHLALMDATCTMEVKTVPGVKNILFGGEGVFHTHITGPGKVSLQSMPIGNVAASIAPYLPPHGH